jgi:hypothetical protein
MGPVSEGQHRRVTRRSLAAVGATILVVGVLTGCQSVAAHGFTRSTAQADATGWMQQAQSAAPGSKVVPESDAPIRCSTDNGYFTTKWEWRSLARITPTSSRDSVFTAVKEAFAGQSWKARTTGSNSFGFTLTLTSAKQNGGHAQVRVVSAPNTSDLTIAVTSPCYDG